MNDYYDVRLKEERLKDLSSFLSFVFIKGDIADKSTIDKLFAEYRPTVVVNLAAQAGVRYSISNPDAYIASNLTGFTIYWRPAVILTTMLKLGLNI